MNLKDKLPMPVGAQYITGKEWRNNSRTNEEMEPKQKNQTYKKKKTKKKKQTNKQLWCDCQWKQSSML